VNYRIFSEFSNYLVTQLTLNAHVNNTAGEPVVLYSYKIGNFLTVETSTAETTNSPKLPWLKPLT